jgi:hypothetical protein
MSYYGNEPPTASADEPAPNEQTTPDPLEQAEEPQHEQGDGLFRRIIG